MPRAFLKKYLQRTLQSVKGENLGKVIDAVFSKKTGKIIAFIVKPEKSGNLLHKLPPADKGCVMIPFPFFIFSELRILLKEEEVETFARADVSDEEEVS